MKLFKNLKMRYKFFVLILVVGIIPMLVMTAYSYFQTRSILKGREEKNLNNSLKQAVGTMEGKMEVYNNLCDYIAYNQTISQIIAYDYQNNYDMYEQYTNVLDPLLLSLKYFHNNVERVTIYSETQSVNHDTTVAPIKDIEGKPWYSEVMNSNTHEWIIDMENRTAFVAQMMPLLSNQGKEGLLYISVNYDDIFSSFQNIENSDYGIYIFGENEEVIYNTDMYEQKYSYEKLDKDQFMNEKSLLKYNRSKYTIINAIDDIEGYQIYLYKPYSMIISSIMPMTLVLILISFLCITFSIVIAYVASNSVLSGIEQLTDNIHKISSGNLVITAKKETNDEIGELVDGFGSMVLQIKILIEEVYEEKIAKQDAEMKALQAQINPHFLYNFLSLVNWKALEVGQEDISKMSLALSTFYRTALNKGQSTMPIRDEVANVKAYLDIQLMMHNNEFTINYEIDDEILDILTLNLVLQPIVENAIEHGILLKENGGGTLSIIGTKQGKDAVFEIKDDGVGMDKEKCVLILTEQSKGYGMSNVNKRLLMAYGPDYGMVINSTIGQGTTVILRIPEKTNNI